MKAWAAVPAFGLLAACAQAPIQLADMGSFHVGGREGWLNFFVKRGWAVYNSDAVERGRSGWAMYPDTFPARRILEGNVLVPESAFA